ncbi:MAG: DUF805 domain-containing protein [Pseudonocardia sp.]|nr:DUF805 domain-containing protein [Pseudonocardia sp.]
MRTVLSKYATFSGRARRSEYWWWYLFFVLVLTGTTAMDAAIGSEPLPGSTSGWVTTLAALALMLPHLAVGARRLHDIGRSGWWLLLVLVPVVGVVALLVMAVLDSRPDNRYGPSPKGSAVAA